MVMPELPAFRSLLKRVSATASSTAGMMADYAASYTATAEAKPDVSEVELAHIAAFEVEPYEPPRYLRNAHLVSMWAHYVKPPMPVYRRERLLTPDDDFIDIDWIDGDAGQPLVLACHGLEGGSGSNYVRTLMSQARERGWHGVAMNHRGCSGEDNRRLHAYHSGWTVDLDFVVRTLAARDPERPIFIAAYSLGGGIVANYLGRRATEVPPQVRAAFLCSVPFLLTPCSEQIERGVSRMYLRHFLQSLRAKARRKALVYPGRFELKAVMRARTLRQFDAAFTCPISGFRSVEDYYEQASCGPHLNRIRVPTFILNALDDPLIPEHGAPRTLAEGSPAIRYVQTEHGGHVAFVHRDKDWLGTQIFAWFDHFLASRNGDR